MVTGGISCRILQAVLRAGGRHCNVILWWSSLYVALNLIWLLVIYSCFWGQTSASITSTSITCCTSLHLGDCMSCLSWPLHQLMTPSRTSLPLTTISYTISFELRRSWRKWHSQSCWTFLILVPVGFWAVQRIYVLESKKLSQNPVNVWIVVYDC